MTKQRLLAIALAVLLVLNGISVALLLRRNGPPPPPRGDRPKTIVIERLGFDADQVKRYEELIARHRSIVDAKNRELLQAQQALFADLRMPDPAHRDSLAALIGRLQAEVQRAHYDHFAQVRALCRPDQLPRFDALTLDLSHIFQPPAPEGPRQ